MTRAEQNKDILQTIQQIERSKQYSEHKQEYWAIRLLLADLSISMAVIADSLTGNKEKDKKCEDCYFVEYPAESEPCCRCNNSYKSMWRAKE